MASALKTAFSLPSILLAAAVESFLVPKVFPEYTARSAAAHLSGTALIFGANLLIYLGFWLIVYPYYLSPLRHVPGPRDIIPIHVRALFGAPKDQFLELDARYPDADMLQIDRFNERLYITKPRLLADLLVHRSYDFEKPPRSRDFLRSALGDGLVTLEGNPHKFLRKNTMPAFAFRHIKELYPMMWTKALGLSKVMGSGMDVNAAGVRSKTIELTPWTSRATMDIIGIAGLGRDLRMLEKEQDPILKIYEELLDTSPEKLIVGSAALLFGMSLLQYIPYKGIKAYKEVTQTLDRLYAEMIHEKKQAIAEKADDHFDILSLLIKSGHFSDRELTDQLLTFLAAGHETTASTFSWACYLLSRHQDVQSRLREEVLQVLKIQDPPIDSGDLSSVLEGLPLLNGVINETLRLFPTVPLTLREAMRDSRLGDYVIPKGTSIVLSMWQMNRSNLVWGPDSLEFKPERWINADGKPNQSGGAAVNYQMLTFLHGPRSCIGQAFAKAELRCLIATLLGTFRWDLDMDNELVIPKGVITMKPANGLYLKMTALDGAKAQ